MQHSKPDAKYGENLYWASAIQWSDGKREVQQVNPKKVVDAWGSEVKDYDYARNTCTLGKMCGHYTQVVWKNTTRVGCAVAVCEESSEQVWVCQYQTPGNWVGEKPY
jgi:pathogenesis-related protein 1